MGSFWVARVYSADSQGTDVVHSITDEHGRHKSFEGLLQQVVTESDRERAGHAAMLRDFNRSAKVED